MTREDAIEVFEAAINALTALNKIEEYCKKSPSVVFPDDILSLIRGEDIEDETEETAYWVKTEEENIWGLPIWECSNCRSRLASAESELYHYKHCHGCGREMRKNA